jgi:uncharacterized protein involved in exopolysaccharide biosynthesis
MSTGVASDNMPLFPEGLARAVIRGALLLLRPREKGRRWFRYGAIGLSLLFVIWAPAIVYLELGPTRYTSKWSLVLPGAGSGAQVNLEAVGQASTLSNSPYGNHSVDPKANYRAIATSGPVLAAAAGRLGMDEREFGKPRVKLIDQTAVMEFAVHGPTGKKAQQRAYALFAAFVERLERLRLDEMTRREEGTRSALAIFEEKLRSAEQTLLNFQSDAGIVSIDQFRDLARNAEELRKQRAEVLAEQRRAEGEVTRLTELLNMSAEIAADVFVLQADELFRRHLETLADADANLTEYLSKWGKAHPRVIKQQARRRDAESALLSRAKTLVGGANPAVVAVASAAAESGQSALLRALVDAQIRSTGFAEKVTALETSIVEFEQRLHALTEKTASLESLERRHQVATAVFTSALARMDLGRSDVYVSYPLVQMLTEPTLPADGLSPNKQYALLGAAAGSLFFITGMVLLWLRRPFIRKTRKSV